MHLQSKGYEFRQKSKTQFLKEKEKTTKTLLQYKSNKKKANDL